MLFFKNQNPWFSMLQQRLVGIFHRKLLAENRKLKKKILFFQKSTSVMRYHPMYVLYQSTCRRLCKCVVGCHTILFYFPVLVVILYNYRRASLSLMGPRGPANDDKHNNFDFSTRSATKVFFFFYYWLREQDRRSTAAVVPVGKKRVNFIRSATGTCTVIESGKSIFQEIALTVSIIVNFEIERFCRSFLLPRKLV